MYLHQQIIDNLLLIVNIPKLNDKLHSKYTYKIIVNNNYMLDEWYIYKQKSNIITKLQYQFSYDHIYKMVSSIISYDHRWKYLIGPTEFNKNNLDEAAVLNSINLFNDGINHGIIPDKKTLRHAILFSGSKIEIVRKCLEFGLYLTQCNMNIAAHYGNIDIFNECLKYELQPNQETLDTSASGGNLEIFNKCLNFGLQPTKTTINMAVRNGDILLFKRCIELNYLPYEETMNIAAIYGKTNMFCICREYTEISSKHLYNAANHGSTDIFKICMKDVDLLPDEDTMHALVYYLKNDILNAGAALKYTSDDRHRYIVQLELLELFLENGVFPNRNTKVLELIKRYNQKVI